MTESLPAKSTSAGTLIVLSGPSGVGKGTLKEFIVNALPQLNESVSVTTRPARPGETDGVDYYFVSKSRFQQMADGGELLEWETYAGNSYGTPRAHICGLLDNGKAILMEIEVRGALNIRQQFPAAHLIFIAPAVAGHS